MVEGKEKKRKRPQKRHFERRLTILGVAQYQKRRRKPHWNKTTNRSNNLLRIQRNQRYLSTCAMQCLRALRAVARENSLTTSSIPPSRHVTSTHVALLHHLPSSANYFPFPFLDAPSPPSSTLLLLLPATASSPTITPSPPPPEDPISPRHHHPNLPPTPSPAHP